MTDPQAPKQAMVAVTIRETHPIPACFTVKPEMHGNTKVYYCPVLRGPDIGGVSVIVVENGRLPLSITLKPAAIVEAALDVANSTPDSVARTLALICNCTVGEAQRAIEMVQLLGSDISEQRAADLITTAHRHAVGGIKTAVQAVAAALVA